MASTEKNHGGSTCHWKAVHWLKSKLWGRIFPIHKAQLLSRMKLLEVSIAQLSNFHEREVADGVIPMILQRAGR